MDKLDVAIDKLTDVTNCLNRMISVQEEKLSSQDQADKHLHKKVTLIEKRVTSIERWKWLVVGGAGVIGFALAKYSTFQQILT